MGAHSTPESKERLFQGVSGSPGIAQGPVFVLLKKQFNIPQYKIDRDKIDAEKERFKQCIAVTKHEISALRQKVALSLSEQEAKILDAHLFILEDKALIAETLLLLEHECFNVDYCFHTTAKRYIEAFEGLNDPYMRERSSDIKDVSRRLLKNLLGKNQVNWMRFKEERIIVADDLSPSDIAEFEQNHILGIATNQGSFTSHAVIMARALNIPAVVGLHNVTESVNNQDRAILDGYKGLFYLNPQDKTCARYTQRKKQHTAKQAVLANYKTAPCETADKKVVELYANIEGEAQLSNLEGIYTSGIGLFRTEHLFLGQDHIPSEEEQFLIYKKIVTHMAPRPVTIRTIDLGGDKNLQHLFGPQKTEVNPFMGLRAIRLCLEHPTLFKEQLRAILRASAFGKVHLLYPMINGSEEILQANQILKEAKKSLRAQRTPFDDNIAIGCMVETPAAALTIDLIAEHCSFISIGTNDLVQYTLAVDRINDRIAHLYQPHHPSVVRMLRLIVESASKANLPLSICGEIASDPIYIPFLIGIGLRKLSLTPNKILEAKYIIQNLTLQTVEALAAQILAEPNSQKVLELLRNFSVENFGSAQ